MTGRILIYFGILPFFLLLTCLYSNLFAQNNFTTDSTKIRELKNSGFLNIRTDSIVLQKNNTLIYYTPNQLFYWQNIEIIFSADTVPKINKYLKKLNNKPASVILLNLAIYKTITDYENIGYPFISLKINKLNVKNNNVDLVCSIDPAEKYIVDSVVIRGIPNALKPYIYRYIDILPKSDFCNKKYKKLNKILDNSDFVKLTNPAEIEFNNKKAKIFLNLTETTTSFADGYLGISPQTENKKKLQITGNFNLRLANKLHKAETIDLNWNTTANKNTQFKIQTFYPCIFKLPVGLGGFLFFERKDSTWLKLNYHFKINWLIYGNSDFGIVYDYWNINKLQEKQANKIYNKLFGFEFNIARTNSFFFPKQGFLLQVKALAGKNKTDTNKNQILKPSLQANIYTTIYKNMVLKWMVKSEYIFTKQTLTIPELYQIGGMQTLRGFANNSLFAQNYAVLCTELMYFVFNDNYFSVFNDFGFLQNQKHTDYWFQGFGFGLGLTKKNSVISLYYAIGKQYPLKIVLRDAKFHIGYSVRF